MIRKYPIPMEWQGMSALAMILRNSFNNAGKYSSSGKY